VGRRARKDEREEADGEDEGECEEIVDEPKHDDDMGMVTVWLG